MSARSARSAFVTTVLTCNDVLRLTVADSIRPRQTRAGGVRHSRCFVTLLMSSKEGSRASINKCVVLLDVDCW